MEINLFNINIDEYGFWISIGSIAFKNQHRSLFSIENDRGLWKLQLLWLANNYWLLNYKQ